MTELRFGPDGYLDLSGLPDGDPDTVLPADELATLHDTLASARPEIDDSHWDHLVHAVVTDEVGDDLVIVAVPGADGGPFALDDWAAGADHDVAEIILEDHDDPHDHGDDLLLHDTDHDDDDPLAIIDHGDDLLAAAIDGDDDAYHLDLDLDPADGDHGPAAPDGDAFVPEEDEHYDF